MIKSWVGLVHTNPKNLTAFGAGDARQLGSDDYYFKEGNIYDG